MAQQARNALILAWLIASLPLAAIVLAPFLLPADVIYEFAPECEAEVAGESPLCGLTTAYIMIGHGLVNEAWKENRASLPLFSVLVWNGCAALWFVLTAAGRRLPRRHVRMVFRSEEHVRVDETAEPAKK